MLFTASAFWILFALCAVAVFANARYLRSLTLQTCLLLCASYYFYGSWDYRFLALIFGVSAQTYVFGNLVLTTPDGRARRVYLWTSIALNVGVIFYFKYTNFFLENFYDLFPMLARDGFRTLDIILPVGISFYVFQTLSYVIDCYRGSITKSPTALTYFTYVAFFPQLVAGPIERATNLLPQFDTLKPLQWDNIAQGLRLVIMGLFLKVVVADQLAPHADVIFNNWASADVNGGTLLLGILCFSVQIYGDFCGYSTIAIGVAYMLGFRLMVNFRTPYFATSISAFWRMWHISLSSFFRDYVYVPLGGSKVSTWKWARNIMAVFLISGLWHGAAWGYVIWGFIHGTLVAVEGLIGRIWTTSSRILSGIGWVYTLTFVGLAWVFFRLPTSTDAIQYIAKMVSDPSLPTQNLSSVIPIACWFIADVFWKGHPLLDRVRWVGSRTSDMILGVFFAFVISALLFAGDPQAFIYFQF